MSKRGSGSSARAGGYVKKEEILYTTDKNGVKVYENNVKDQEKAVKAYRAFSALSEYKCVWNKGFDVIKDDGKNISIESMKRSQQWNYLKDNNIHEFKLRVAVGDEKRALKLMEDYGYHVKAKLGTNSASKDKSSENTYYLAKDSYQRLTLDFKLKTYYKKGWRG